MQSLLHPRTPKKSRSLRLAPARRQKARHRRSVTYMLSFDSSQKEGRGFVPVGCQETWTKTAPTTDPTTRPIDPPTGQGRIRTILRPSLRGRGIDAENQLLIAVLRARIPTTVGIGVFTSRHPETFDRSLEPFRRQQRRFGFGLLDKRSSPQEFGPERSPAYPDVLKVDALTEVGNGSLYRVTFRNPPTIPLFRVLGIPIHFPLRIQGGFIRWEVVARRSEAQAILAHFRKTDSNFQVVSLRRQRLRSHLPLLTPTQNQLLAQAMAAGYFAVPRRITLTGLANKLGRSKSSLSEMMANIERKLLESALNPTSLSP
jgi:hypothetical protein